MHLKSSRALVHAWSEWSMSNFSCSLTRNITSHSIKNLAFHSLLSWQMIILPILTTSLIRFSLEGLGECTFWIWVWKGLMSQLCSNCKLYSSVSGPGSCALSPIYIETKKLTLQQTNDHGSAVRSRRHLNERPYWVPAWRRPSAPVPRGCRWAIGTVALCQFGCESLVPAEIFKKDQKVPWFISGEVHISANVRRLELAPQAIPQVVTGRTAGSKPFRREQRLYWRCWRHTRRSRATEPLLQVCNLDLTQWPWYKYQ